MPLSTRPHAIFVLIYLYVIVIFVVDKWNSLNMNVSDLTPNQLPYALAQAMKVKSTPVIDWELCGKLIEKEKLAWCVRTQGGLLFMLAHVQTVEKRNKLVILLLKL